jgi:hypothetical protein
LIETFFCQYVMSFWYGAVLLLLRRSGFLHACPSAFELFLLPLAFTARPSSLVLLVTAIGGAVALLLAHGARHAQRAILLGTAIGRAVALLLADEAHHVRAVLGQVSGPPALPALNVGTLQFSVPQLLAFGANSRLLPKSRTDS